MELSLICPVAHLEYTSLLPGRFAIAPVAARFKTYRSYFTKAACRDGYSVTLDNGVFENDKMDDRAYIELACEMQPKVLIIPDTINSEAAENWDAALQFIELAKCEELKNTEFMFVPQCKAAFIDSFWDVLDSALGCDDIQWIGICRDAVFNAFGKWTHTEDQELNRFYFATELERRFGVDFLASTKWHFLGVGNRWDLLQHYWFVDSMDTASLFYQSTLGNIINEYGFMPGVLKRPTDYFIRDFNPRGKEWWAEILDTNCQRALAYAQQATTKKRKLLGDRL